MHRFLVPVLALLAFLLTLPSEETSGLSARSTVPGQQGLLTLTVGDVDCTGGVTSVDALFVLREVAGLDLAAQCMAAGDVNCDGVRDAIDSLGILRAVAGLPSIPVTAGCSPVGTPVNGGTLAFLKVPNGGLEADIFTSSVNGSEMNNLTNSPESESELVWSPDGSRLAFVRSVNGAPDIFVLETDGDVTNVTDRAQWDQAPAWSPDGSRIAFSGEGAQSFEVFVINADGSGLVQLTDNDTPDGLPSWSPAGDAIAFVSERDGNAEIYAMNADGSGQTRLTFTPEQDTGPIWSPDGSRILFEHNDDDVYAVRPNGLGLVNLSDAPGPDGGAAWSPDGTRVAFSSKRSGTWDVWVVNADGSGLEAITGGTTHEFTPAWSPEGKRIAFLRSQQEGQGGPAPADIWAVRLDVPWEANVTNSPDFIFGGIHWRPFANP